MDNIKYLYHATKSEDDANSIIEEGFETNITFFCSKPEHAAEFLQLTNGDGDYYIVKVDVSKLDSDKLEVSNDHNPAFYSQGLESFMYIGEVPFESIVKEELLLTTIWRGTKKD